MQPYFHSHDMWNSSDTVSQDYTYFTVTAEVWTSAMIYLMVWLFAMNTTVLKSYGCIDFWSQYKLCFVQLQPQTLQLH